MEPNEPQDLASSIPTIMDQVAEKAAQVAIDTYRKERQSYARSLHDKRIRDTKHLLRMYRELKAHSEKAVYELSQVEDEDVFDVLSLMTSGEEKTPEIVSIKNSALRTRLIVDHIDTMLALFKKRCDESYRDEDHRRNRVIHDLYIDDPPFTPQEIADMESIDLRTVYKDIDAACEKLAAYIFGFSTT